jgi:hypothetical protein
MYAWEWYLCGGKKSSVVTNKKINWLYFFTLPWERQKQKT